MYKALVEEIINNYSVRVRIPVFDKAEGAPGATTFENLAIATICTANGSCPNLQVKDIVYVDFENNDRGAPVIMGTVYNNKTSSTSSLADTTLASLSVEGPVQLASNTSIGDVASEEISALKGVNGNIQGQLTRIDDALNALSSNLKGIVVNSIYPIGSIYMSLRNDDPATLFGGTWEQLEGRFLLGSGQLPDTTSVYTAGNTGGEAEVIMTEAQMPSHSHSYSTGGSQTWWLPEPTGETPYTLPDTLEDYTQSTGNDEPHDNMPPFLVVNMWKRTA